MSDAEGHLTAFLSSSRSGPTPAVMEALNIRALHAAAADGEEAQLRLVVNHWHFLHTILQCHSTRRGHTPLPRTLQIVIQIPECTLEEVLSSTGILSTGWLPRMSYLLVNLYYVWNNETLPAGSAVSSPLVTCDACPKKAPHRIGLELVVAADPKHTRPLHLYSLTVNQVHHHLVLPLEQSERQALSCSSEEPDPAQKVQKADRWMLGKMQKQGWTRHDKQLLPKA